jgi:hypothetical protein
LAHTITTTSLMVLLMIRLRKAIHAHGIQP